MMPLLAEVTIPVSGEQVASWLACLFFIVAGVNQVRRLAGKEKLERPLRVELEKEFTPRDDHDDLRGDLDRRMSAAKDSRDKMHNKLAEHGARLSALEASDLHQTRLLQNIDGKLDTITKTLMTKN